MFDHAIFQIGNGEFNTEGLQYGYKKLYNFIGLHKKVDAGYITESKKSTSQRASKMAEFQSTSMVSRTQAFSTSKSVSKTGQQRRVLE